MRKMFRILILPLDVLVTGILASLSLAVGMVMLWVNRFRLRLPVKEGEQRLLTVLSGSSVVNAKRNIGFIYEAGLLNGYFSEGYYLYFLADQPLRFDHTPQIHILDFRSPSADLPRKAGFLFLSRLLQQILFLHFAYRLIRVGRITLMQANDPYIQGMNAFLLKALTGVPFVVKVMCDYDHYYRTFGRLAFPVLRFRWIEKQMERIVYHFADGITAWNANYMHYVLQSGGRKDRIRLVPTLVDERFFAEEKGRERPQPPFSLTEYQVVFYLGRISWDKYCLDLIPCLVDLKRRFSKVKLVILGDGELRGEFESRARSAGVMEEIYLPGVQTVEQIIAWARSAQVMLATHAGFSLIEMGALGVPVVAYDYEWHGELIRDQETGRLVPFRDHQAMAAATGDLLSRPEQARRMGESLRALVMAEHHPQIVQQKMTEFFRAVVAQNL